MLGQRTLSRGGASYLLPRPSHSVSWVRSSVSGVPCISSGELVSDCDPLGGCQPSRIPGRLGWQLGACSQFGRGCRLWGLVCPFPSGSGRPPASLPLAGDGLARSRLALLWYSLSPLFCERQCLRLELFLGKFSLSLSFFFFFFKISSLASPWFGLLSHVSSLRLPSGH